MATSILITGASGPIGKHLTAVLVQKGYRVVHLSRSKAAGTVPTFIWDIHRPEMDTRALEGVSAIIHLAGAGVADKRWTASWKEEILQSRVQSTRLLYESLRENPHQVKTLVSASGIGYYGLEMGDRVVKEDDAAGNDFLAEVVKKWEGEVDTISTLGVRTVKMRIGMVLSKKGGALEEMARPIRFGIGAPLGSGKQLMSWIHIDDLCRMLIEVIENKSLGGVYNATAPNTVTNAEFTKTVAKVLQRPLWLPNIPAFVIRTLVGEFAEVILNGCEASSEKIRSAGFQFQFPALEPALKDLLKP